MQTFSPWPLYSGPTDDEIRSIIDSTDLWSERRSPESRSIVQITPDLVVKLGWDVPDMHCEALAMQTVRAKTRIPVPRPIRVFEHDHSLGGKGVLLMEYIPDSRTLKECWTSLSIAQKDAVANRMADYIRQLRTITVDHPFRPGQLGPEPGFCFGLPFGAPSNTVMGPYPNIEALCVEFRDMYNGWLKQRLIWTHDPPAVGPLEVSDFSPLVFTHNDLNMRNILLDGTGCLWIVDWAWSGMYPKWFEYISMLLAARKFYAPKDWLERISQMADKDTRVEGWMSALGRAYEM